MSSAWATRLRVRIDGPTEIGEALDAIHGRGPRHLVERLRGPSVLLGAVDLALQMDPALDYECRLLGPEPVPWELPPTVIDPVEIAKVRWHWPDTCPRAQAVDRLAQLLADADSIYTVQWDPHPPRLMTRSDPTVARAAEHAITTAGLTAGQLLHSAWDQTHRLHPDPAAACDNAIRAVEQVLCPLVLPTNQTATLGTVVRHLCDDAPHKWAFALRDRDCEPGVEPLASLARRLWQGHHARHGGPADYGQLTTAEATAAVHIAVAIVALVSDGALTRRAAT